jgi:hypothetical protein
MPQPLPRLPIPIRTLAFVALACVFQQAALAELRPDKVRVAQAKKTEAYLRDGLITGGDEAINEVSVKDIRRASNAGYERIVIDLEGTKSGEAAAIPRPPFYQISVTPDERRIVVTIWGKPKLNFDSKKVVNAFKRSSVIQNVELMPRVEEKTWTFVFGLKGESPVEVFELSNPVRIIMDIKADPKAKAAAEHGPSKSHAKPKAKAKGKPKGKKPHGASKPAPAKKADGHHDAEAEGEAHPQEHGDSHGSGSSLDGVPAETHGTPPSQPHTPTETHH